MTEIWLQPGIDSREVQERKCLIHAYLNSDVVRMRQAGFLMGIPQWLKVLSVAECVFTGTLTAVIGLKTSGFVTVVLFTCTSCYQHSVAVCDTAPMKEKVEFLIFCSLKCTFLTYPCKSLRSNFMQQLGHKSITPLPAVVFLDSQIRLHFLINLHCPFMSNM